MKYSNCYIFIKKFGLTVILLMFFFCTQSQRKYSAPDFTLNDVFGKDVNLYDILDKGRPVLIIAWTLWSKPSINEIDALISYKDELKSMNIQILAISLDSKRSTTEILPFALEHKWIYFYRILLDTTEVFRNLYNIQAIPTTIAIDRNGDICFTWSGYKTGDEEIIVDTLMGLFDY